MSEDSIRFPNLNITLQHVPDGVDVFGFHIAFYGIIIALAIMLASVIITREARRLGYREEDFLDFVIWGAFIGIVGARIYYVIFSWERYRDRPLDIFNLRQGGLAIYGGIIIGTLTVVLLARRRKVPVLAVLDVIIFGMLPGQIMGRWGNFFNREAFGRYTDGLFAMQLPVSSVRQPEAVTEEMLSHAVSENGLTIISVHPSFLYESLWNLAVFVLLWNLRKQKRADGVLGFAYLALYGAGRFWIEGLRTDQLMLFDTGIAVSRLVSALAVSAGVAAVFYLSHSPGGGKTV